MNRKVVTALLILFPLWIYAQVGDYRNSLSIGGNTGYILSNVGFDPKVSQSLHSGITAGLSVRYVCEKYSRTLNYLQIPVFAHLAWGREQNGFNFFVQAGPQIGILLNETLISNYDTPNLLNDGTGRSNTIVKQESMPVEKKFDYGIAAGLGAEWSIRRIGHILLEARYYYGLGNIYGNSKKDFFGKSNNSNIIIKLTYLYDIVKNKNNK